ncbi:MAG: hypothetical protein Q7T49_01825 [bacterium]|nr:hypothetical protein [bacterium]
MDILGKLFGTPARVKLLRLFLFSAAEEVFTSEVIVKRVKLSTLTVRKELRLLEQIGLVKNNNEPGKKRSWYLNPKFSLTRQLKYLLDTDFRERRAEIGQRFKKCGQVKLLIIAGSLIGDDNGRADLVLVGDSIRRSLVEQSIRSLEAEVGKEIVYALLETKDFYYRLGASDKFIRDLLDYPHERLINKLDF